MKKPLYIKLSFPSMRKGPLLTAVRKYFKGLAGKVIEADFGKERSKKIFKYKITACGVTEQYKHWEDNNTSKYPQIEIQMIPEKK